MIELLTERERKVLVEIRRLSKVDKRQAKELAKEWVSVKSRRAIRTMVCQTIRELYSCTMCG